VIASWIGKETARRGGTWEREEMDGGRARLKRISRRSHTGAERVARYRPSDNNGRSSLRKSLLFTREFPEFRRGARSRGAASSPLQEESHPPRRGGLRVFTWGAEPTRPRPTSHGSQRPPSPSLPPPPPPHSHPSHPLTAPVATIVTSRISFPAYALESGRLCFRYL